LEAGCQHNGADLDLLDPAFLLEIDRSVRRISCTPALAGLVIDARLSLIDDPESWATACGNGM